MRTQPYKWVINLRPLLQDELGEQLLKLDEKSLNKLANLIRPISKPVTLQYAQSHWPNYIDPNWTRADWDSNKILAAKVYGSLQVVLNWVRVQLEQDTPTLLKRLNGAGSLRDLLRFARAQESKATSELVAQLPKGYSLVKLTNKKAFQQHAKQMSNCVYSYWPAHQAGKLDVFALLDKTGQPQATLEIVNGNRITQVEGPANKSLTEQQAVEALLLWLKKSKRWKISQHALDSIGQVEE